MGKQNRSRFVNVPAEFVPLLNKELDEKGYFAQIQLTGEILAEHFRQRGEYPPKPVTPEPKEKLIAKEVKLR
ncbi:hypothetical protein ES708_33181 [subsurface metagenome]